MTHRRLFERACRTPLLGVRRALPAMAQADAFMSTRPSYARGTHRWKLIQIARVIVSKLVQTAMAMVSLTKIRTTNINARHAGVLVLYLMTTTMKK
jgi:hypothetical protein